MQEMNKITETLLLYDFGEPWTCQCMPDQTQQILQDLTKASMGI